MEILIYLVFLLVTHLVVIQIFSFSTHENYFWKAFPILLIYSAATAWTLLFLSLHQFFTWHLGLASILLVIFGIRQAKASKAKIRSIGDDPDAVRSAAKSASKNLSNFTVSSIIYIVTFGVIYVWLYNAELAVK